MTQESSGSTAPHSRRGLYVTLGAVLVLAVLVVAAVFLPRVVQGSSDWYISHFKGKSATSPEPVPAAQPLAAASPTPSETTPVAPDAAVNPPTSNSSANNPAADMNSGNEAVPAAVPAPSSRGASMRHAATHARSGAQLQTGPADAGTAAPQPAAASPDTELLGELETQQDHLTGRAAAITASLDSLRKAQSAQGVGLRGDIVAAEQQMQTFMARADASLQKRDAKAAQRYLDSAEAQARILEKFLGR
jgi:cytoskeletal protein RodZ